MKPRRSHITKLKRTLRRMVETDAGAVVVTLTPHGEIRVRRKWGRADRVFHVERSMLSDQRELPLAL